MNRQLTSHADSFPHRWWIEAPGDDETLSSLVERGERLYAPPNDNFHVWQEGCESVPSSMHDAPNSREMLRLAHLLGVPVRLVQSHRMEDGAGLLAPHERRAYCPQCVHEDYLAGRPRAFRRGWARVLLVSCLEHNVPLQWAEPRLAPVIDTAMPWRPTSPKEADVVLLTDMFARTLEACLWSKVPWPRGWRGSAVAARALLIRCLSNLTAEGAHLPISQLWIPDSLRPFVGFPSRRVPPVRGVPWGAVRRTGRPAWRRAALWLTAWGVIPDLPDHLRPETIPSAYLEDVDVWWDCCPEFPDIARLRSVHRELRRQSARLVVETSRRHFTHEPRLPHRRRAVNLQELQELKRLGDPPPAR